MIWLNYSTNVHTSGSFCVSKIASLVQVWALVVMKRWQEVAAGIQGRWDQKPVRMVIKLHLNMGEIAPATDL